jgi:hypothetical protein
MSSNIQFVNLSQYEPPIITESKRDNWVEFGGENNYFQFLIDRYNHSTTNAAIINNVTRLIYGRGLGVLNADRKPNEYAQVKSLFHDDCIRKIVMDRKLLGQFALQVHYNQSKSKILKAYHMPVNLLRAEKCNKDGEIEGYYYSDDWTDTRKFEPKRIPAFGFGGKNELIEIIYSKPYTVGMKYYAYPDYQGSLPYALMEQEIAEYLINDVQNGFSPTMIVNFNNGVPTEEQMNIIDAKVKSQLTGPKGKKVVTSYNENAEMKTTVDAIPLNDAPEHYQYLSEECMRKIMLGHNVTSPLLFGVASTNGFSSNADELKNSAVLFDNMVIRPIQDEIIAAFEQVLHFNGLSVRLFFKTLQPLEFTDLENAITEEQVQEETGTELSKHDHLDNEIADDLINLGEIPDENWILIDEFDVDYDQEEAIDKEIEMASQQKQSLLSKVYNFVSTGTANPKAKSEQDKVIDGFKFITRYVYAGQTSEKSRQFCQKMTAANKVYRKEDIDRMSNQAVNAGWGPKGAATYDIFLYKGGGNCHHKWMRRTYVSFEQGMGIDPTSPNAKTISTNKAEKAGYRLRNPQQVAMMPVDMPHNGFLPTNPIYGNR